ncbi:hypothetical protein [Streptomyces avicenniae]|uniref:hypothetical protein n=1 Tax=Streptomyces avicenniae TaxID=500153 RepID=UPI00069C7138|nr:hypothetical protein [Streptomyces avicenniae]
MGQVSPLFRSLLGFARAVGHGVNAGNAIRHGRRPGPASTAATAARDEAQPSVPPAVAPGPLRRDRTYRVQGDARVRDGS